MKSSLEKKCSVFIRNRDMIKSVYKWENNYIVPVCAAVVCAKGVEADKEMLLNARDLVNKKTGIFSNYRGNVKLPIMTMLAADNSPEEKLAKSQAIYGKMKNHFFGSEYLTMVSTMLTDMINADEAEKYAQRGKAIYNLMKKEHPFLTTGEDSVFAVLMAFSEKTDNELIDEMEQCFTILKKNFSDGDAVQTMSHILALAEGTPEEKCGKVTALYQKITESGKKYSKYFELAVLCAAALVTDDYDAFTADVIDADDYLAEQEGYKGILGMDRKTRLMHAVMLTSSEYSSDSNADLAAMTGTLAMAAAQQAAMCAVIAASSASAAATSN